VVGLAAGLALAVRADTGRSADPTTTAGGRVVAPPPAGPAVDRPLVGRVGDTAAITVDGKPGADITVTRARSAALEPGPFGDRPHSGRFLIVDVSIQATGRGFAVNPLDFYVRAADGSRVEEQCCADFGRELDATTLGRGARAAGAMVFDVARGPTRLVYAPNLDATPVAEWRL
jgi:hypothetical protein